MPALDFRRRSTTWLFIIVVVIQLVLISAQVSTKSGAPVLEAVTFGIFSEVQVAGSAIVRSVSGLWTGYFDLRGLRDQNRRLQDDLTSTRMALQQERALAQRSRNLQALLDLREAAHLQTVAADVIAAASTPDFRTVTIGKGTRAGLRRDMAVLAPGGVVGRVIVPSARAAKVQLLIDRNAAAGALVERSRAQGVVLGTGDNSLRLEYVTGSADVKIGDTVVTSGIDGIYPKGFVIGTVQLIERTGGSYGSIVVQPALDFSSIEEVLVVTSPPLSESAAGSEGQP